MITKCYCPFWSRSGHDVSSYPTGPWQAQLHEAKKDFQKKIFFQNLISRREFLPNPGFRLQLCRFDEKLRAKVEPYQILRTTQFENPY